MLQIITYMLAFYLVIKGIEVLQIALASTRERRDGIITIGVLTLAACILAAFFFVAMQEEQAKAMNQMSPPSSLFNH